MGPLESLRTERLFFLGRDLAGVLDTVVLTGERTRVLPVFRHEETGQAHLQELRLRFPGADLRIHAIAGDDLRAKEELLQAGSSQGATVLWFDPDPASLHPAGMVPLAEALLYLLSYRTQVACL